MAWYPGRDAGAGPSAGGREGRSRVQGAGRPWSWPVPEGAEAREEFPEGRAWWRRLAFRDGCYPPLAVWLSLLAPAGQTRNHRVGVVFAATPRAAGPEVWGRRALPPPSLSGPQAGPTQAPSGRGGRQSRRARAQLGQRPCCSSSASCCGSQALPDWAEAPGVSLLCFSA